LLLTSLVKLTLIDLCLVRSGRLSNLDAALNKIYVIHLPQFVSFFLSQSLITG